MGHKGRQFEGLAAGASYRRWARLFGMTDAFYRKAVGNVSLSEGMKSLDLGCGPGSLSFALAERSHPRAVLYGIDISDDQINYAKRCAASFSCSMVFMSASMDELSFPDEHFDVMISSMALHETPPEVRRAAIAQTARVLKSGGVFVLVDWSRPKLGLWGVLWLPLVCWGDANRDNWNNVYPELCRKHGLMLKEDDYINSLVRRQVFRKEGSHGVT